MVFAAFSDNLKAAAFSSYFLFNLQIGFTADRYFVICHPLISHHYKEFGYQKWIIGVGAVVSLLVTSFATTTEEYISSSLRIFGSVYLALGSIVILVLFCLMKAEISRMVMSDLAKLMSKR
jgi:hypothetical protein